MRKGLLALLVLTIAPLACGVDTAPTGLRATPPGSGPTVVFDLTRRPIPEIPAPNDVATIADPTSRTGRRINVSLSASTVLERKARDGFNDMEGWGTFAPITVSFSPAPGADSRLPALDLDDLRARMQKDGYDFSNDAVYVINLKTGLHHTARLRGHAPPARRALRARTVRAPLGRVSAGGDRVHRDRPGARSRRRARGMASRSQMQKGVQHPLCRSDRRRQGRHPRHLGPPAEPQAVGGTRARGEHHRQRRSLRHRQLQRALLHGRSEA